MNIKNIIKDESKRLENKQVTYVIKKDILITIFFFLLVIISTLIIAYTKIDTYRAWRYTSDLFSFDTVLQENLKGNLGLEFTYGNAFGDHAYLFLILLIPIKYLLGNQTIYILLLLGPIAYGISSIVFYTAVKHIFNNRYAFFTSSILLLGFSFNFPGLLEKTYGMHPDTISGYLAVILTVILLWHEHNAEQDKPTLSLTIIAVATLLVLITLKEEMALLGVIYFFVVWLLKKNQFHAKLLFLSIIVFIGELSFIKAFTTPFNRTNGAIVSWFVDTVIEEGFDVFLTGKIWSVNNPELFFSTILLSTILFFSMFVYSKRINVYVLGLFLIGLVKLGFSLAVLDLHVITWHNFPGFVMLTAAILLQFTQIKPPKQVIGSTLLIVVFAISLLCFALVELPFIKEQLRGNSLRKDEAILYTRELVPMMKMIDPLKVSSIPQYTARQFVGYRYAYYPRGVLTMPDGLADYVIYPINEASRLGGGYERSFPVEMIPESFKEIERGQYFIFYKRVSLSEQERVSRDYFRRYGLD